MSRRFVAIAVLAAASAACQRNLELPPVPDVAPLSVSPAFITVAPRQTQGFLAAGGEAPYAYAFARGGQLSGADATVDPLSGAYQAGSDGSALDLVEVTDARGAVVTASVSVGPRLALAPLSPSTTPGGAVVFSSSGGDGSYTFAVETAASGPDASIDPVTGAYVAGSIGPASDTITVTDGTGAVATTAVTVTSALRIYRAETGEVAPHEAVTLVAIGGKPPYTFSILTAASGAGAAVDPVNGTYTAGDRPPPDVGTGIVTDVVQVTDQADVAQSATLSLPVGPRLALALSATEVHPGETARLVATGGKAPYVFGFAARVAPGAGSRDPTREAGGNGGNRSGGAVEAATGEYRPGASPGAVDFFQVTDATGAPAAIAEGPPVGGTNVAIGTGMNGCAGLDLDGDGSGDVAFFGRASTSGSEWAKIVTATQLSGAAPVLQPYYLTNWVDRVGAYAVGDFAGAGRSRLVAMGGNFRAGDTWENRDIWEVVPDLAGDLEVRQLLGGPGGTSPGVQTGAAWLDGGSGTWHFFSDGQLSTGCPAMLPWEDRSILGFTWSPGTSVPSSPSAPTCYRVPSWCTWCAAAGTWTSAAAFAVGDFGGDANLDVAFINSTENDGRTATGGNAFVSLALGNGTDTFDPAVSGWPAAAGYSFAGEWNESGQPKFVVARAPGGAATPKDVLLVRLVDPSGRPKLFVVRDPSDPAAWTGGFDPNPAGGGVDGVVAVAPHAVSPGDRTAFAAWSGSDGQVVGFELDWSVDPPVFASPALLAEFPFAVTAACFSDVNTDGTADMVAASDWGATGGIVLGDGTNSAISTGSTYGLRVHQRGIGFPVALGDLDGDGFGDAAAALPGRGLAVLWGGGGQLAWGPEVTNAAVGAAAIGDFTGSGGGSILFQEKAGKYGLVAFDGGGSDAYTVTSGIPGTDPTGTVPSSAYFLLWPSDLGTSATPGADALTMSGGDGSWLAALLVQASPSPPLRRVVDVHAPAVPIPDQHGLRECWPTAVGLGQPWVAAICSFRLQAAGDPVDSVALFGATIQNPDAAPGSASPPAFTAWTQLSPALTTDVGGNISPPVPIWAPAGVTEGASALGGTIPAGLPGEGTAIFVIHTDRLYAVEVTGGAGGPAGWTVSAFPVGPAPVHAQTFLGAIGKLDAAPDSLHAVLWANEGLVVLRRTAGPPPTWTFVQQLTPPLFPIGIAPLAAGSPGDAVGFLGNFDGLGVTPELVPLLNDGSGILR